MLSPDRNPGRLAYEGDRATCERVAPRWREHRLSRREADRLAKQVAAKKGEIDRVVRRCLEQGDSRYRELLATAAEAKKLGRACDQVLAAIRTARQRIRRADRRPPRTEASRSNVDRDVREVSNRIATVRDRVMALAELARPTSPFDLREVVELDPGFPGSDGDSRVRTRKYKESEALLDSLRRRVESLRGEVTGRARAAKEERSRYVRQERARFDDRPPS